MCTTSFYSCSWSEPWPLYPRISYELLLIVVTWCSDSLLLVHKKGVLKVAHVENSKCNATFAATYQLNLRVDLTCAPTPPLDSLKETVAILPGRGVLTYQILQRFCGTKVERLLISCLRYLSLGKVGESLGFWDLLLGSIELQLPLQTYNSPFIYMHWCNFCPGRAIWDCMNTFSTESTLCSAHAYFKLNPIIYTSSFDSPPIQAQFRVKHGLLPPTLLNYLVLSCIVLYRIVSY